MLASRQRIVARWCAPVPALPVALFRIATAVLACAYLVRLAIEAALLHGPLALTDQALVERALPFTWQPLFRPDTPLPVVRTILGAGAILCVPLALGLWPRRTAFAIYAIVVCATRSHFSIASVDDGIVHLLLFWCVLLPTGASLALGARRAQQIPGGVVRAATWNFALIYLVAGIAKWMSPMWRDGSALHAVLSLRPSYGSAYVDRVPDVVWTITNYGALAIEPAFALLIVLRPGSSAKRWLATAWILFHLALVVTFDVALANLGCLALGILAFRTEIARWFAQTTTARPVTFTRPGAAAWLSASVVAALIGAMATSLAHSGWRDGAREHDSSDLHHSATAKAFFGPLWAIGLMQQYRLLDWIDDRNYAIDFHADLDGEPWAEFDERWIAPKTMRGSLLLSPFVGARWCALDHDAAIALADHTRSAIAARLQPRVHPGSTVRIWARIRRVHLGQPSPTRRREIVRFRTRVDGGIDLLSPFPTSACVASSQS